LEKITEEVCINIDQILSLLRMGDINRQLGTEKGTERSSKSHLIFRISIETIDLDQSEVKVA